MALRTLVVLLAVIGHISSLAADERVPQKVALLVGVNRYLKPGFNDLQFAEADVSAVGEELQKLGFRVTKLLGSSRGPDQATRANIQSVAAELVRPLGKDDIVFVMLSGHGQQLLADPKELDINKSQSYYCPVDARLNDPETQVSLSYLLDDVLARDVGRTILIVDACRDIPVDSSRGSRSARGVEGRRINLPEGTGVFFSCSAGQMSFEKAELGHGLFTYCVLEGLRGEAAGASGDISWSRLVAHVDDRMTQPDLVKLMPTQMRQVPIPSGALPQTILGRVPSRPGGNPARVSPSVVVPPVMNRTDAPAPPPAPPISNATVQTSSIVREGSRAGEVQSFAADARLTMCWCPPGGFVMGSPAGETDALRRADPSMPDHWFTNEAQVPVTLTRGFWIGQTELTRGQWRSLASEIPWATDPSLVVSEKDGPDYPVVYVTWDEARDFCQKLTAREVAAGRLTSEWEFTLPTEAQWEYACRAGTVGPYNGDGSGVLGDYAWYENTAGSKWSGVPAPPLLGGGASTTQPRTDVEDFAHIVGQKKPNRWGLHDMHGNVQEWCLDYYNPLLPGGPDPLMNIEFATRVTRGGEWTDRAERCRSAMRHVGIPNSKGSTQGLRLVLTRREVQSPPRPFERDGVPAPPRLD